MDVCVLMKAVPASTEVSMDPVTHTIVRDGGDAVWNPFDTAALELALRLKDGCGATVTVLSMGIPATAALLRDAVARGADRCLLLSDRAFAGSDTLATSYALTLGLRALGGFDLVLCDVMMPGLDGFELVRQIRPDFDGPIIFLTARVAEEDAVAGYGLGADDYVRKPFGAAELRAKVAAHLRRERRPRSHALSFGEVRIDLGARGLAVGGEAVPLTPTEYAICEYLARHPGQVMSRAQIREAVLGWESDADDAAISMQVSRARRKLSEAGADPIATVWGMGYKWQL